MLQCVAALRLPTLSTLLIQCVAVCCSVLQCVAYVAVCCSVLQRVAVYCSFDECNASAAAASSSSFNIINISDTMCCSVLQCIAVCCSMLQYVAALRLPTLSTLLIHVCVGVYGCDVRLYLCVCVCVCTASTAAASSLCCSVLQYVAVRCIFDVCNESTAAASFLSSDSINIPDTVRCGMLQCVAVCCSVLQCIVVRCSVLQYVAVHCIVLQLFIFRLCHS